MSFLQNKLNKAITDALAGIIPLNDGKFDHNLEIPKDESHGDFSTNIAMRYAKLIAMNPRELAQKIVDILQVNPIFAKVDIAGAGFINMTMSTEFWAESLVDINFDDNFGQSDIGRGEKTLVEFISANPTGPLHVGHARGAVFGAALARLLQFTGHKVLTEYYINDAGSQINALADSVYFRYQELHGTAQGDLPEHCYPGEYITECARDLMAKHGDEFLNQPRENWQKPIQLFAIDAMMNIIKGDCELLNIRQESFISERKLVEAGKVQEAIEFLTKSGDVYRGVLTPPKGMKLDDWEAREQLLFASSKYGDDIDRPLQKSDGSYTYFANDIANHYDKYHRGFTNLINIFGADHAGYIKRMKSATTAISKGNARLDILTMQIVRFMKNGEPLKMSKRAGNFVALSDLIHDIGADAIKIFMLSRKPDTQMDFDYAEVCNQSKENPVFYLHYANARTYSVEKMLYEAFPDFEIEWNPKIMALLSHELEIKLIKKINYFPKIIEQAAIAHEPHRIVFAMIDCAAAFHALWTKGREENGLRFVKPENRELTLARIGLILTFRRILAIGADIIGVNLLEQL